MDFCPQMRRWCCQYHSSGVASHNIYVWYVPSNSLSLITLFSLRFAHISRFIELVLLLSRSSDIPSCPLGFHSLSSSARSPNLINAFPIGKYIPCIQFRCTLRCFFTIRSYLNNSRFKQVFFQLGTVSTFGIARPFRSLNSGHHLIRPQAAFIIQVVLRIAIC